MRALDHEQTRVGRAPDMITAPVGDGALIMHVTGGNFIELNPQAARIWELLDTPQTLSGLCTIILDRYDVAAEQCRADIGALLEEMLKLELVRIERA